MITNPIVKSITNVISISINKLIYCSINDMFYLQTINEIFMTFNQDCITIIFPILFKNMKYHRINPKRLSGSQFKCIQKCACTIKYEI